MEEFKFKVTGIKELAPGFIETVSITIKDGSEMDDSYRLNFIELMQDALERFYNLCIVDIIE